MKKLTLLAGLAALTLPVAAYAGNGNDGNGGPPPPPPTPTAPVQQHTNISTDYTNSLAASISAKVSYTKNVSLNGNVNLKGDITVDSSAVATSDPKQINEYNTVTDFGENTASADNVGGAGNIGVNSAAGFINIQSNVATIASNVDTSAKGPQNNSSTQDPKAPQSAGWAEANTVTLQQVWHDSISGTGSNTASAHDIHGSGNIGVNVAAGAFNTQENVLTMAVVKDSVLAEANTGNLQLASDNKVNGLLLCNNASVDGVNGTGNIGVNVASGAGNIQSNTLTIATTIN